MHAQPDEVTACFSGRVAAWFEREGRERIADPVYLRQMNMAIALAASRWNEFAAASEAAPRMRAWLGEVHRRAVTRNARARAEAFEQARAWFDECCADI